MTPDPVPLTPPPALPALGTFLRRAPEEMGRQVLSLFTLLQPLTQAATAPPRTAAPADSAELDEAYRFVLQTTPAIGQGAGYPATALLDSAAREAALHRLRAALTAAGQGLVDNMALVRAGLYAIRVRTDSVIAELLAAPGPHYSLRASWSLVEEAEARPQLAAKRTRDLQRKARAPLADLVSKSESDGATRQQLERLLQVAGVLPAPRPVAPALVTAPPARTLAPRGARRPGKKEQP